MRPPATRLVREDPEAHPLTVWAMAGALLLSLAAFVVLGGPYAAVTLAQGPHAPPSAEAPATPPPSDSKVSSAAPAGATAPTAKATATAEPTATVTAAPTATATEEALAAQRFQVAGGAVHAIKAMVAQGSVLQGSFTVDRDISFSVQAPNGAPVYIPGLVTGKQTFSIAARTAGVYTLNFDNRFSPTTAKVITQDYRVLPASRH